MPQENNTVAAAPAGGAEPPLTIRLFGPFEVHVDGHPLPRLRYRKSQSVLALLALRQGAEVERDWLAGLLLPTRWLHGRLELQADSGLKAAGKVTGEPIRQGASPRVGGR
jgi:hypothetical protein